MDMQRLLLVDDEPHILSALQRSLRHALMGRVAGLSLEVESDPQQALKRLAQRPYALVLSDYRMPGLNGVQLLTRLRELQPLAGRLILSGEIDREALSAAINEAHIHHFLVKPWNDAQLAEVLLQALAEGRRRADTEALAAQARATRGEITPQELERQRLEQLEPGITHVEWGADGAVIMDPLP